MQEIAFGIAIIKCQCCNFIFVICSQ